MGKLKVFIPFVAISSRQIKIFLKGNIHPYRVYDLGNISRPITPDPTVRSQELFLFSKIRPKKPSQKRMVQRIMELALQKNVF